jgi:UDP-N-acetylmuramoyl-L-alanyl-D-glutamate--2,6-diaminopimelate ligase
MSRDGAPITCVAEVPDAATPEQLSAYGRVLERAASRVILTQSRRSVRLGQKAVWQVLDGCDAPAAIQIVPNRETAIELAIRSARPGEQVLLAGWGADSWTSDRNKAPRNDFELAKSILANVATAPAQETEVASAASLRIFNGRVA